MLDLRAGTLVRRARVASPAGDSVRVRSTRLVSLAQRAVGAILYEVEPVDGSVRVVVQSELVANEPGSSMPTSDPRAAAVLEAPLESEDHFERGAGAVLLHSTSGSELRMGAAMDHMVDGPDGTDVIAESSPDVGRVTVAADLASGSASAS